MLIDLLLFWSNYQLAKMLQPNSKNQKDCLKDRFLDANLVTQISLERDRLKFLKNCIYYKRPPQSLRVRGLNGLDKEKK